MNDQDNELYNTKNNSQDSGKDKPLSAPVKISWWKKIIQFVLVVAVLGGGIAGGRYLINNKPKPVKKKREIPVALVETVTAVSGKDRVELDVLGVVGPSREVSLRPQVSGNIVWVSSEFEPGGVLKSGREVLRIEPVDYQLAVQEKKALLSKARADMAMEMGHQEVAKRELALLGGDDLDEETGLDLVLRKPQLAASQAAVDQAAVALQKAELDLKRTSVRAPFGSLVVSRNVNLGTRVSTQDILGSFVDVDEYWVEAKIPVSWLKWVVFPHGKNAQKNGSKASVRSSESGRELEGRVLRLKAGVAEQGKMAGLIVAVKNPIGSEKSAPDLLLNQYVHVKITGKSVEKMVRLDRDLLRDGQAVWVLTDNSTLDIRPVDILWKDKNQVLVSSGIADGEQIVVSNLTAPVQGMTLQAVKTAGQGGGNE